MREDSSAHVEALLELVDNRRVSRSVNSAFSIDDLSSFALLDSMRESYDIVQARFTGALPAPHSIGLREATSVLGAFQEVLSEVAASLRGSVPKRGPLPSSILAETALQLSPQVAPGSVIFTLLPVSDEALFDDSTLLDDALAEILDLFSAVELPVTAGGTPDTVAESLRRFGPRTARHLVRFASALKDHDLNLDLGVARSDTPLRGSRISSAGAKFLYSLAENATRRTAEIEVVGEVHNLSRDHRYKINVEDRGRINVRGSDSVTDVLQKAFRSSLVVLTLLETESINLATGAVNYTFEATRAVLADEEAERAGAV